MYASDGIWWWSLAKLISMLTLPIPHLLHAPCSMCFCEIIWPMKLMPTKHVSTRLMSPKLMPTQPHSLHLRFHWKPLSFLNIHWIIPKQKLCRIVEFFFKPIVDIYQGDFFVEIKNSNILVVEHVLLDFNLMLS